MKFFAILLLLAVDSQAMELHDGDRISSGVDAKKGENLDAVWFTANFHNQWIRCSGVIWNDYHILTSTNCVYDPVEGAANWINVTFPQLSGRAAINTKQSVFIDYGTSGPVVTYDIGVIKLVNQIPLDDKKVAAAKPINAATAASLVGKKVRVAGMGIINNTLTYPKNLQTVDMLVVEPAMCSDEDEGYTIIEGAGCLTWSSDNNVCPGDYGSGVWTYTVNDKGVVTEQNLVGIVISSPEARYANAPCKDGHKVVFYPISIFLTWLNMAVSGQVPPVDV